MGSRDVAIVLLALLLAAPPTAAVRAVRAGAPTRPEPAPPAPATAADDGVAKGYEHLAAVMDRFHIAFDVYTDSHAAGNHFAARGAIGSKPEDRQLLPAMDEASTETPHTGLTAIKVTFRGRDDDWGGWYFLTGVLQGDATAPSSNWGTVPNAGEDLRGASTLSFWARGARGGETVEFLAFGVGRDAGTGRPEPNTPYPDSAPRVSLGPVTLSNEWQEYRIDLRGRDGQNPDLRYVLGGFGWVATARANGSRDIAFYLDDIRYDKPRLEQPRFLVSYEVVPGAVDFDTRLRNVAFTYDNALALIAFTAAGDARRARLLADAFVYAQEHDRTYSDGRLRNAYRAGDLVLPPGWTPAGRASTVSMPGWWTATEARWVEDADLVGSTTGDVAWALLALLNFYETYGGAPYLAAAGRLGAWIERETRDACPPGGYTGGYGRGEPTPTKFTWKSTEHNLDLAAAFARLAALTGDARWQEPATHARAFVEAMWEPDAGHYWTGTVQERERCEQPNTAPIPLDTQTWAALVFGPTPQTRRAMAFAEANHKVTAGDYSGFDFNEDRDLPWFEGTAQMALAYRLFGEASQTEAVLEQLRLVQATAPNGNGNGIVAAPQDGLTTGFDGFRYYNRLHVGATAWYLFAERGYNPYWPTCVGQPPCGPPLPSEPEGSDDPG
jgi:hypothetical protein